MNNILTRAEAVEEHLGDPWKREPFQSPALANVDKLSVNRPQDHMSIQELARVGTKMGLDQVVRWKPRNVSTVTAVYAPQRGLWLISFSRSLKICKLPVSISSSPPQSSQSWVPYPSRMEP